MSQRKPQKDIDKAIAHLIQYAERAPWADRQGGLFESLLDTVADELDISPDELVQTLEPYGLMDMVFGYCFEQFATCCWDGEDFCMIDEFLKRRGWHEAPYGRRYLTALNNSDIKLWEVVDVKPGHHVELRPFDTDSAPLRVYEKAGSMGLKRWDCVAARVLLVDGKPGFSGSMLPFRPEQAQEFVLRLNDAREQSRMSLLEMRDQEPDCAWSEEEILALVEDDVNNQWPDLLIHQWMGDAYLSVTRPLPTLMNTEGDFFQSSVVKFPVLESNIEAIKQRLHTSPLLAFDATNQCWEWLAREAGALTTPGPLLGHLRLDSNYLTLSVNSVERAEDGKISLKALLGELIGQPLTVHESLESLREKARSLDDSSLTPVQAPELITSFLDQHYRSILDQPIPALDHQTPRECAAQGDKGLLMLWLKGLENSTQAAPQMAHYDFRWMWDALGVEYPA